MVKKHGGLRRYEKVVECIALEQFFLNILKNIRFWVHDRDPEMDLRKVAGLMEDYSMRRGLDKDQAGQPHFGREGQKGYPPGRADSDK